MISNTLHYSTGSEWQSNFLSLPTDNRVHLYLYIAGSSLQLQSPAACSPVKDTGGESILVYPPVQQMEICEIGLAQSVCF